MALHLIRHPRPAVAPGLCYGRLDLALAEPVEPADWRARLPALPRRVISSPAQRCRALAAAWSTDFTTDPAWQELDFGTWEGRPWAAIDRAESDPWAEDVWHLAPPGGETYAALTARVRAAVRALLAETEGPGAADDIVVVTHAGPIRAVHAWVDGLDERRVPALPLAFGQVSSFGWPGLRAASRRAQPLSPPHPSVQPVPPA